MVDWDALAKSWTQISEDLRRQIIESMRQKQKENPVKFNDWLKESPGRQIIWTNFAVIAPTMKEMITEAGKTIEETYFGKKTVAPSVAAPVKPSVAVAPSVAPRPTKILSSDDMRRLQDFWTTEFFRSLGRVPPNIASVFRVEFESVKDKPFDVAKEAILKAADEIIEEMKARETARRAVPIRPAAPREPTRIPFRKEEVAPGEEEGGGVSVPFGRVPPAQFPSFMLCYNLPFPRGPCSEEKIRIWNAFLYQMQQQGYDGTNYQRQFDDYISGTQFLSWEDLRDKFNVFVKTIMSGQQLPPLFTWRGTPIPTGLKGLIQEREPLEKLADLVTHYSSVVIRNARSRGEIPTLADLKDELVERSIIPEETSLGELRDAVKTALTQAVERKDLWMAGISTTEINDFVGSGGE
jgi:hypothetical protein